MAVTRLGPFLVMMALILGAVPSSLRADEPWQLLPLPQELPQPASTGYATINGVQLYYASFGDGEPLLLLHGPLGNADYWGNQVAAFARHYRVIILDTRGHGRSSWDSKLFSYRLLASDVLALLDQLKIDRVSIVGWGDGGNIALELAITHPERLHKAFLFDANFNPGGIQGTVDDNDIFVRYIERAGRDYQRLSRRPQDYELFFHVINLLWGAEPDFTPDQLASIKAPIMIATGDHDEFIRPDHAALLARLIPGSQLDILQQASFFAMWQQPDAFNNAVLNFLASR